jgi:hypothetical protein
MKNRPRDTKRAGLMAAKKLAQIERATYEPDSPPWRACRKIIMGIDYLISEGIKGAVKERVRANRG